MISYMFLGMFTKHLLKANNWLRHPSGHMEQLGYHWMGFYEILYFFQTLNLSLFQIGQK